MSRHDSDMDHAAWLAGEDLGPAPPEPDDDEEITWQGLRLTFDASYRPPRSKRQNDGFHAMLTPWARGEGHAIDDLKRDLLGEVFGFVERPSVLRKGVVYVLAKPHTSQLTKQEFSELIERTLQIAAECGVQLTPPDEYLRQLAASGGRHG